MLLNHYKNPNFDFKTDEDMKSHAAWIAIHELSHLDQKKDFIKMFYLDPAKWLTNLLVKRKHFV